MTIPTVFNVCASPYNADPTGASDSTSAIQSAMTDAGKTSAIAPIVPQPGVVYFPTGKYLISSTLTTASLTNPNISFKGDGPSSSVIVTNNMTSGILNATGYYTIIDSLGFGIVPTNSATFTASISAANTSGVATMTVTSITSGALVVGATVTDSSGHVIPGTYITAFGTGTGLTGTYTVKTGYNAPAVSSETMKTQTGQTSGTMITLSGVGQRLTNFTMNGAHNAIASTGSLNKIDNGIIGGFGSSGGVGIDVTGANITWLDKLLVSGNNVPSVGIRCSQGGELHMTDLEIITMGIQLDVEPGSGQTVSDIWATQCYFDGANGTYPGSSGIILNPGTGGNVTRAHFIGCWTGGHTNQAFLIGGSTAVVEIVDLESVGPPAGGGSGLLINTGASGVNVSGGTFTNNAGDGITVGGGVTDFSITGVQSGAYGASGNHGWGIYVFAGASNRYVIANNRLTGNTSGGLSDNGSGTNKNVAGNIT